MLFLFILFSQLTFLVQAVQGVDIELKFQNLETLMLERLSTLEAVVVEQKEDNLQLKQEMTRQKSELLQLKQDLAHKQGELTRLKRQMAHQKSDISDMKTEINEMKTDIKPEQLSTEEATWSDKDNGKQIASGLNGRQALRGKSLSTERERRLLMDNTNNGNTVAFYAYISRTEAVQKHKTLIFDVTMVNYAKGYNNNTGSFTSPASGLYVLTFTVHPSSNSAASVEVVVNTKIEGTIFSDSSSGVELNAATAVVIVWMNQGDVSFVRTHTSYESTGSLYSTDQGRCSFAGWKISD